MSEILSTVKFFSTRDLTFYMYGSINGKTCDKRKTSNKWDVIVRREEPDCLKINRNLPRVLNRKNTWIKE